MISENGKTYNVTLHAVNSTDGEKNMTMMSNQTTWHAFKPAFTYEVLNKTLVLQNGVRYIDVKVKITYAGSDIASGVPSSVRVYYLSPVVSSSASLSYVEGTAWATGYTYQALINLGYIEDAPWYGDIALKFKVVKSFYLGGLSVSITAYSPDNYTIAGTAGGIGTYGVAADEWNVYDDYAKTTKGCCCDTMNYTMRSLIKVIKMGRMCSADFFLTQTYYWSKDYKVWVSMNELLGSYDETTDLWGKGPATLQFLDPNKLETMFGFAISGSGSPTGLNSPKIVPKKLDFKKVVEFIQNNTGLTVKLSGIFGKKMVMNTTSAGFPAYITSFTLEYDSRMVLKQSVYTMKYGCKEMEGGTKWISKGKGALPKGDGSSIDGFSWIYLLGLGLMTIGVVSIIMRKKAKVI